MSVPEATVQDLLVENEGLREELRIAQWDAVVPVRELREEIRQLREEHNELRKTLVRIADANSGDWGQIAHVTLRFIRPRDEAKP